MAYFLVLEIEQKEEQHRFFNLSYIHISLKLPKNKSSKRAYEIS